MDVNHISGFVKDVGSAAVAISLIQALVVWAVIYFSNFWVLTLKTTLVKKPAARIEFEYEIHNEQNELLTKGFSTLVFVNMSTNRPTRIPDYILTKIEDAIQWSF